MRIRIAIAAIVILLLTTSLYATNYKPLDRSADVFVNRLWSGAHISQGNIKDSLDFLYSPEKADKKYGQTAAFKTFLQATNERNQDNNFQHFSNTSEELFETSDIKTQMAIHMLVLLRPANSLQLYKLTLVCKLSFVLWLSYVSWPD